MKKILAVILVLLISVGIFVFVQKNESSIEINNFIPSLGEVKKESRPIKLLFVGDIMFDRGVKRNVDRHLAGDYNGLFKNTPYLQDADITFGNLEGPVALGGRNVGSIYSFRMEPKVLDALKNAGFDIVSFANNHVGDYTKEAFDETLDRLNGVGIKYVGAGKDYQEATMPNIIEIEGVKFGYLGFTDVGPSWLVAKENSSGTLLANDKNFDMIISSAKSMVDVLVVSFHFGDEYSPTNKRQESISKKAIDMGADIVVGHHAHVMQSVEEYNGKIIFYGLGNFIFDQYFSEHTMRGMVASVLYNPETKEFTKEIFVSPLSRQFVPQEKIPFNENMLIKEKFVP